MGSVPPILLYVAAPACMPPPLTDMYTLRLQKSISHRRARDFLTVLFLQLPLLQWRVTMDTRTTSPPRPYTAVPQPIPASSAHHPSSSSSRHDPTYPPATNVCDQESNKESSLVSTSGNVRTLDFSNTQCVSLEEWRSPFDSLRGRPFGSS
ncbi:hypothetical protein PYCCODRAFT_407692 [Trametes coccinea BRFM310]|uniref:Uncharacterized protein n=1 Tax=Trametes coccinea (strain BRFM310) TaxID=1353009 RepID=A0A1Y2IN13_TRAC3|nr:hypothetical protein PYCCODRAFT_407692 [Trametes coccinea BRFM310]